MQPPTAVLGTISAERNAGAHIGFVANAAALGFVIEGHEAAEFHQRRCFPSHHCAAASRVHSAPADPIAVWLHLFASRYAVPPSRAQHFWIPKPPKLRGLHPVVPMLPAAVQHGEVTSTARAGTS